MGLPQYGGEGKEKYKGHKSDMTLKQHGGEGNKGLKKAGLDANFTPGPSANPKYTGPGRTLKKESF